MLRKGAYGVSRWTETVRVAGSVVTVIFRGNWLFAETPFFVSPFTCHSRFFLTFATSRGEPSL